MKLLNLQIELQSNKEVTVNGRPLNYLRNHDIELEEKVIEKNVSLEQQWIVLCEMRKLEARLESAYRKSRIRAGEITESSKVVSSGAKGIPGTSIGKMPGHK